MCGLTGFVSTKNKPDLYKLMLMSIGIRERGKDAVGILVNNRVMKFVSETKTGFQRTENGDPLYLFTRNLKVTNSPKKFADNTCIIHNRARSKGGFGLDAAHPFIYEINGVKHTFAHNGTLSNETELCAKYGLNETDFVSDSHKLGYIIAHHGFGVLSEYKGSAAFLYHRSDEPNTLYAWKGASRQKTEAIEEERPLYYCKTKEGFYFCSVEEVLDTVIAPEDCFEVPDNTLMVFNEEDSCLEIVDRSHIPKEITYNYNHNYNNNYNNDYYSKKPTAGWYNKKYPEECPQNQAKGSIYWWKGVFYQNGHPVTGKRKDENSGIEYYLFFGNVIKDEKVYNRLVKDYSHMSKEMFDPSIQIYSYESHKSVPIIYYTTGTALYGKMDNQQLSTGKHTFKLPFTGQILKVDFSGNEYQIINDNYVEEDHPAIEPNFITSYLNRTEPEENIYENFIDDNVNEEEVQFTDHFFEIKDSISELYHQAKDWSFDTAKGKRDFEELEMLYTMLKDTRFYKTYKENYLPF